MTNIEASLAQASGLEGSAFPPAARRVRREASFLFDDPLLDILHDEGVAPIPASSGKTNRHRLSRGGHRQANSALYRVVIVRMRFHQPTIDYVARRSREGRSKREIIRCLKRYVAREVFPLVRNIMDEHDTPLAA